MMLLRYIATHSHYSRRKACDLIKDKQVRVNGMIENKPWYLVQEKDEISVAGQTIKNTSQAPKIYLMLNKPGRVLTTMADDEGRLAVSALIKGASKARLFPIGRLDKDSTGILLFTNDGHLAQQLSHPKFRVTKEYAVTLNIPVLPEHLKSLQKGIFLSEGKVKVDRATHASPQKRNVVHMELHSGKNRVIRRIFAKLGYKVKGLDRINYAGLTKQQLACGAWRKLLPQEITHLRNLVGKQSF